MWYTVRRITNEILGVKGLADQTHVQMLTLYTLTSVYMFSMLFSIHIIRFWEGEFDKQSIASVVDDYFLSLYDFNV